MATSSTIPYVFTESFSTKPWEERNACRSGWKRNGYKRRKLIQSEDSFVPERTFDYQDIAIPKIATFSDQKEQNIGSNDFVESNVSRLTSKVIEKTKNRPSYNISAHIYTKKEENFSCSINKNCIPRDSLYETSSSPNLVDQDCNLQNEEEEDWRASLKLLQAEIKKVTELPDINNVETSKSNTSSKFSRQGKSGGNVSSSNTRGTNSNDLGTIKTVDVKKEAIKYSDTVDSEASIIQTALDIRQKYRTNRTIEKLKYFETPMNHFGCDLNISNENKENETVEIKLDINGCEENDENELNEDNEKVDDVELYQQVEETPPNSISVLNAKENDSSEIVGCVIEVLEKDSSCPELIAQDHLDMEQVGCVILTLLLEPTIIPAEVKESNPSVIKEIDAMKDGPRIIQKQRRRIANVTPSGKNAPMDWREELRQRERAKRDKKYGLVAEANKEKVIKHEPSTELFGPGYKPPEKSHVFDWRSCLSNTKDESVSNISRNKPEKKFGSANYLVPPPPTPREKWKLLDKASKNSSKISIQHTKEQTTKNKQEAKSNTESISSLEKLKTKDAANAFNSANALENKCQSTTVKVINFVAIKTTSNIATKKINVDAKTDTSDRKIVEDRDLNKSDKYHDDDCNNNENSGAIYGKGNSPEEKISSPSIPDQDNNSINKDAEFHEKLSKNSFDNQSNLVDKEIEEQLVTFCIDGPNPIYEICAVEYDVTNRIEEEFKTNVSLSIKFETEKVSQTASILTTTKSFQQKVDDIESLNIASAMTERKSPLIFSEPQSNFITDNFLLDSMFGTTYSERVKKYETPAPLDANSISTPSFHGTWRSKIDASKEPLTSNPSSSKSSSTSNKPFDDRKKNYSELLQQSLIDVKKTRARDTISNVLQKKTGYKYYY